MSSVIFISTCHKEHGICNSNELYKIIEQIHPDIIFEELSPTGFTAIYQGTRSDTLETNSIKLYLRKYDIDHFPVDLEGNKLVDKHLKNDIIEMFKIFGSSQEYVYLSDQLVAISEQLGFKYLNTDQCMELLKRRHQMEELILKMKKNEKLFRTYKVWLAIVDLRETEMINNIYKYYNHNMFDKALFLVGAEHRQTIMDKILKIEEDKKLKLNWIFDYFD